MVNFSHDNAAIVITIMNNRVLHLLMVQLKLVSLDSLHFINNG